MAGRSRGWRRYLCAVASRELPESFFDRIDTELDERFYISPRFVQHIDDSTIAALTDFYRERLVAGAQVLDLMSSWVSHLPEDTALGGVVGLGMNRAELEQNPRLDEWRVHDLNREPDLPFEDERFDAVFSYRRHQYLR